jgi:pyruvate/2-oxoglutarate dehydrogenase complex dihydrolipoamide acyltransferase (E2) component
MIAPALPGIEPEVPRPRRGRFWRVCKDAGEHLTGQGRIMAYITERRDEDDWCRDKTAQIAAAVDLTPSTVGLYLGRMAAAGLLYIEGGTRRRRIRPLLVPKDACDKQSAIRMRAPSNPGPIRRRAHSNLLPQPVTAQCPPPDRPLLGGIEERNNVDVIRPIPETPPACVCVREGPGPVEDAPPPAPPVVAAPPVAAPDPRDRSAAAALRRLQALQERRAAEEAAEAARAVEDGAAGPQTPQTVAARQMATPAPAPRAPSPHVETPDLIRRLKTQGAAVVALVVARLCEKLDPDFEPLYRRCCADVLAGRLEVGAMIGAFRWARNAPGFEREKGPSFAAYIARHRETQEDCPRPHRRE